MQIVCPKCQKKLSVQPELVGRQAVCPCGQTLKIEARKAPQTTSVQRTCSACGKKLKIPSQLAGKAVKCPCGQVLKVEGGTRPSRQVTVVEKIVIAKRMLGQQVAKVKCPKCGLGMTLEEAESTATHACPECGSYFRLSPSAVSKLATAINLSFEAKQQKAEAKRVEKAEQKVARSEAAKEKKRKQREAANARYQPVSDSEGMTPESDMPVPQAASFVLAGGAAIPETVPTKSFSYISASACWYCGVPVQEPVQCAFCRMLI